MQKNIEITPAEGQLSFSTVLFDTLFGLVLYFSIEGFLDISDPIQFIFCLFSAFILVHWWLIFRSVDDAFSNEVWNSAADLVFGIIYIIMIDYNILLARRFEYEKATYFLLALLIIDCTLAMIWRYVGEWRMKDKKVIRGMEHELDNTIRCNISVIPLFILLIFFSSHFTPISFVATYIAIYILYGFLTFKYHVIDVGIF